ncbi:MAG: ATP-binding protein [Syntrophomonadaceae bacterium]
MKADSNNYYQAVYHEQEVDDFSGNPFIEALPPVLSEEGKIDMLTYLPRYDYAERGLSAKIRYEFVNRLFEYFEPLPRHIDLERKISSLIRRGYLARNPLSPDSARKLQKDYRMRNYGGYSMPDKGIGYSATGMTIIGISGMGKTRTIDRILSYFPQTLMHSNYHDEHFNQFQLSWLKLDCPYDGSIKGLCINFFLAVDELLETNFFKKFGNTRNSVDVMLPRMKQIADLYGLGMLVIDEIQHLNRAKSGGAESMLNFFVTLINTIGVPVVLVGTPSAFSVLRSEFRQARRGSGQGDIHWDRLAPTEEWQHFLNGMWKFQWTKNEAPLTEEIKEALYYESQGIVDIVIKLYALAQWKAIAYAKETITPDLIHDVAKENLQLVKPMLDALRSGDRRLIDQYEDIKPLDIEQSFEKYQKKLAEASKRISNSAKTKDLSHKVILRLLDVGIEAPVAEEAVYQILKENTGINDITAATKLALERTQNLKNDKQSKQVKKPEKLDSDDLRSIIAEKDISESESDSLETANVIKPLVEQFIEKGQPC